MTKYYRELWIKGPVRTEARRLAKQALADSLKARGIRIDLQTPKQVENAITVLLFNSEDVYLKRAKWNLENQGGS